MFSFPEISMYLIGIVESQLVLDLDPHLEFALKGGAA